MNTTDEQGSLVLQRLEDQVIYIANQRSRLDALLAERDSPIRAALNHGHTYKVVGFATGLSRGQLDAIRNGRRTRNA